MPNRCLIAAASGLVIALAPCTTASAQDAAAFFKDRNIRIVIGHATGGDYDMGTRLLARHLPRHIPGNPKFTVQNMPGAAGVVVTNYLFEAAPKDGSVMGSFSRNMPVSRVRQLRNLRAEVEKFQWLGATSRPGRICIARTDAPVKQMTDLKTRQLVVAGSGAGSIVTIIPTVLNNLMGMQFKIIEGYKGMSDMMLAVTRGEVQGYCLPADYLKTAHPDLLPARKVRVLFVTEEEKNADYPDAPSIFALAANERDKQIMRLLFSGAEFGRPYVYPPGVPAHLVDAMRKGLAAAVKDPALMAEANKTKIDMSYISPAEMEKSMAALMVLPKDILAYAEKLMPVKKR